MEVVVFRAFLLFLLMQAFYSAAADDSGRFGFQTNEPPTSTYQAESGNHKLTPDNSAIPPFEQPPRARLKQSPSSAPIQLSLIVSAEPANDLKKHLLKLQHIANRQRIPIGQVIIIGRKAKEQEWMQAGLKKLGVKTVVIPRSEEEYKRLVATTKRERATLGGKRPKKRPSRQQLISQLKKRVAGDGIYNLKVLEEKFGLKRDGHVSAKAVVRRYQLKISPTWIVRIGGEDHVFEGNYDPSGLFDYRGRFIGDKNRIAERKPKTTQMGEEVRLDRDLLPIIKHQPAFSRTSLPATKDLVVEAVFTQAAD